MEAAASGGAGGKLTGGPFDQRHDTGLESKLALFRTGMQTGAHMLTNAGITSQVVNESQISDAMGGMPSVDPAAFARRQTLEGILKEDGISIEDLSEEEIAELLAQMEAEENESTEEGEGDEEPHGTLFEDLQPGDVQRLGGMASLLKARGYANAEAIASHIESGHPANEWFGLTGGSLQDAKRLQWLYVRAGQKGHF